MVSLISHSAEPEVKYYYVQSYKIAGEQLLNTNELISLFSSYTGTNITADAIGAVATALQQEYEKQGGTNISVSVALDRITNGVVTLNVFRTPTPQILLSGKRYTNGIVGVWIAGQGATNAPPGAKAKVETPFTVRGYEIHGDTLLSTNTLMSLLVKYTGTNITSTNIFHARNDLQLEYRDRGYPTVSVVVPQQRLTNGIVHIQVFEGRLASILVTGNRFFTSNNVMRALPSLHTNMILSSPVFQAELDRANANQNRQIYPELEAGPVNDTTTLRLRVKDRLPLHARIDLDNQNTPNTPDLRLNSSLTYDNLWQLEHTIGVQYTFSPEEYKSGSEWPFYDRPLIANYSAFYRMPLSASRAVEDFISARPGSFGYDEATHQFRLPPTSGLSELNLYASRSTIDTGLQNSPPEVLLQTDTRKITKSTEQQDLTTNQDLGFRLSEPLPQLFDIRSVLSAGFDWKKYHNISTKNYVYQFTEILHHSPGDPGYVVVTTLKSPLPTVEDTVPYAPLTVRWDANRRDKLGLFAFGLNWSANFLNAAFNDSDSNFESATGSSQGTGYYQILNANLQRDQILFRSGPGPNSEWHLNVRADGQWANQPLISNEQFGIGGLNGVRGYHEGEVYGDTGWRMTSDLKTPPQLIGSVFRSDPLIVRGAVYMDYATVYLLEPNGRPQSTSLWGAGFGGIASIGPHWETRMWFSWPLLSTSFTERYNPRFDFILSVQF
jgi:hemolysin activation/secretion protein